MDSVTFFGEVNELSSRAIWWSDDDDDQDDDQNNQIKVVINTNNNIKCDSIYVTIAKSDKTIVKELQKIGSISIDGISGTVGHIFAINETSIWLQLNANYPTLKNHLLVKTIANLMKELLTRCQTITDKTNKPLIRIISTEITSNEGINYLSNNSKNLIIFPKDVQHRALMAPKMMNNLIESSVFEYCTVFDINCIALILSELQSTHSNNQFIPKQILTAVRQFNDFSDSNIFI